MAEAKHAVEFYEVTLSEYNKMKNDGKIKDTALYFIEGGKLCKGNVELTNFLTNIYTHIGYGKTISDAYNKNFYSNILLGGINDKYWQSHSGSWSYNIIMGYNMDQPGGHVYHSIITDNVKSLPDTDVYNSIFLGTRETILNGDFLNFILAGGNNTFGGTGYEYHEGIIIGWGNDMIGNFYSSGVIGEQNTVDYTIGSLILGQHNNTEYLGDSLLSGYNNTTASTTWASIITGSTNKNLEGASDAIIAGCDNSVDTINNSLLIGYNNNSENMYQSIALGNSNIANYSSGEQYRNGYISDSILMGSDNKITKAYNSIILGSDNDLLALGEYGFGNGIVLGRYCDNTLPSLKDKIFIIGNGSGEDSLRSTCFSITKNGEVECNGLTANGIFKAKDIECNGLTVNGTFKAKDFEFQLPKNAILDDANSKIENVNVNSSNFVVGPGNTLNSPANSIVSGSGNTAESITNSTLVGGGNTVNEIGNSIVGGSSNTIKGTGNSLIIGSGNEINQGASLSLIGGSGNKLNYGGNLSIIAGSGNKLKGGDLSLIVGSGNEVTGGGVLSLIGGNGNSTSKGDSQIIIGSKNNANGSSNITSGTSNINEADNSLVIGKFCEANKDNYLVIGGGTSEDNRKNVFSVTKDGTVYCKDLFIDNEGTYLNQIKALTEKIEELEARIAALENKNI